ncbi:MAG: DUF92 domain-containing protein [Chloroflexota bacterium]
MQLPVGFILGCAVALLAWRLGSLSASGAMAAAVTGGLILGIGGLPWASLLLTFFISSSALSRAFRRQKARFHEKFSKGDRRDWAQVLANGGLGALLVIGNHLYPHPGWWVAYAGAMATVNADTWATEIGVLSRTPPRLITSGKVVEGGTSGGVSWLGTLATLGGAALIGGAAVLTGGNSLSLLGIATLAGLCGSLFDSVLGATIQAIYTCPSCEKETERHPMHTCGARTEPLRGWPWLDNDRVNFFASLVGMMVALLLWYVTL